MKEEFLVFGQPAIEEDEIAEVVDSLRKAWLGTGPKLACFDARSVDLSDVNFEIRRWSLETEVSQIQNFDVGIMPLSDTPFERGKCGYKILHYFACGRPSVASPVGVNSELVESGRNGFLASTANQWVNALAALRDNVALRQRMGARGRQKVEEHYSLEKNAPRLASLLRKAAH